MVGQHGNKQQQTKAGLCPASMQHKLLLALPKGLWGRGERLVPAKRQLTTVLGLRVYKILESPEMDSTGPN